MDRSTGRRALRATVVAVVGPGFFVAAAHSPAAEAGKFGPDPKAYQRTLDRAVRFLATRQSEDGGLSTQVGIGPTALATFGLLRAGRAPTDPQVAKSLKYLEEYVQESGGIHKHGPVLLPAHDSQMSAG